MVEGGAADGEAVKPVADEGIAPGGPAHCLGPAAQFRRQFARPTSPPAARPGRSQAGHGPLPDQIPLQLGQRAAGGGGSETNTLSKPTASH